MLPQRYPKNGEEDIGLNRTAVSQTEGCILRRSHLAAYVIKPGLVLLTEHYICESKAYYNNLHVTKNNGQIYNAAYKCDLQRMQPSVWETANETVVARRDAAPTGNKQLN